MNIVHINYIDIHGSRFNGNDLSKHLRLINIRSYLHVWSKKGSDPFVYELLPRLNKDLIDKVVNKLESILSVQSFFGFSMILYLFTKSFRKADIIHLHIFYTGFMSLHILRIMTIFKPLVWTIHDPWAVTGHCIHPGECDRWKVGCGKCPDLNRIFPIRNDRTHFNLAVKTRILNKAFFSIIVASNYMKQIVSASDISKGKDLDVIPFGINHKVYNKMDNNEFRSKYCIPEDAIVLMFRSTKNEFKGLKHIIDALKELEVTKKIFLVTVETKGLLSVLNSKFSILEFGWITDERLLAELFNISDIFLMPSLQEAFGLMAIEAMACGVPVIVFSKTALEELIDDGQTGLVIEHGSAKSLRQGIKRLVEDNQLRESLGIEANLYAHKKFSEDMYVNSHIDLYRKLLAN